MEVYHKGASEHLQRERYAPKNHVNALQQKENYEHLKDVEHQKEQLEKKCEELQLKHAEIEQREKDLKMKMALDAYEQLCLNIGNEGRSSIRQLLVNLCQAEFERNFEVQLMLKSRSKKIAQADKEVKSELESLFEKDFQFAQTQAQGNIWMIGELYNYGILSDNMLLYFISRLLEELSDTSWIWLCELIVTVHTSLAKNKVNVDKYFLKIKEVLKTKKQLSKNSETLLQNIILDWEAKADPESLAAVAEDKLPKSEPVAYKPTVYTVQSFDKPNSTADPKPFREFHRQSRGGKRGRFRGVQGLGSGSYPSFSRPPLYPSIVPTDSAEGYIDWYEQNYSKAYNLPKYPIFNQAPLDGYPLYGTRLDRSAHDTREQKMKKKPRHQQNQNKAQESSFATKKELLDGEMKIGFRKQTQTKTKDEKPAQHSPTASNKLKENTEACKPTDKTESAPKNTEACKPTDKRESAPENTEACKPTDKRESAPKNTEACKPTDKRESAPKNTEACKPTDKGESAPSPQNKLWNALCAKIEDERNCTDDKQDKDSTSENMQVPANMKPEVPKTIIQSSEIPKIVSSQEEDADVLILSESIIEVVKPTVKAVCQVESPKNEQASMSSSAVVITDDRKSESEIPCENSSGTSEYSSPMESPVPCELEDKLWEYKQTSESEETAGDAEKAEN